ncbi:putative nuclease HARBI1 [Hydra vulgaris]|uniref:putative nuclease HARBI1 n=1 Tax=Hydra vulgaris TaxID=6087 RepID=UPI001F5F71E9|nr:putative nuclease HARBI1 [Hydra vulgaris]
MSFCWNDDDWIQNIRISKAGFNYLCKEVSIFMPMQKTNFRKSLPIEIKLAVTLYFLSGSADYRTIGNLFGLGKSTVCTIVHKVCKLFVDNLLKKYIFLPSRKETIEIMASFEKLYGFPQVVGAVDGCHIRIKAPYKNSEDYINRKDYHSIILQGLADSKYLFRDIFVGWTGKSHDSRVFKNSPLYKECLARTFLPNNLNKIIDNIEIGPLILGDSAYSLENWLMKPYSDRGNLSIEEAKFNASLSKCRVVIENAFGRLKGRFQCLLKRLDTTVEHTVNIVTTCCILHNFCTLTKQIFLNEWIKQTEIDLVNPLLNHSCIEIDNKAEFIRSAIKKHYFTSN